MGQIQYSPRTAYLGEIDHRAISGLYAAADLVLNTSLAEGQPQAALEGMSLGLPAIMTAVTGNLGIMTGGREGFYVRDPGNWLKLCCVWRKIKSCAGKWGPLRRAWSGRITQLLRNGSSTTCCIKNC